MTNRTHTEHMKIDRVKTGLRADIFVHVDYDDLGQIHGIRYSHKSKEKDSTLDAILTAIGDAATEIITKPIKGVE